MSFALMRKRAGFLMAAVALVQAAVLGVALGFLVLELTRIRADVVRLGHEEQDFLSQLSDTERASYRTSILLRDHIMLEGPAQRRARVELTELLASMARPPLTVPSWMPEELRGQLDAVEAARREYLSRASMVAAWDENDRRALGGDYLSQQLAPMRENYVDTTRSIAGIVRSIRETRTQSLVRSMEGIQSLVVRSFSVAVLFAIALAALAIWRFRTYERERDLHVLRLRKAEEDLRALSQRLVESQEQERKKLSRELHDEVGQILTALRVQLGQIEPAEDDSRGHLGQASGLADRSLKTVREMARGLRPAMLDDLGLGPALKWLGRDLSRSTDLDVDVEIEGELEGLDEASRTCIYRVVQEALTNCVRHARFSHVRVLLHESPNELVLTVQDNGAGFTPGAAAGIGLLGMKERVEEIGGKFTVISAPGAGTLIRANVPRTTMRRA